MFWRSRLAIFPPCPHLRTGQCPLPSFLGDMWASDGPRTRCPSPARGHGPSRRVTPAGVSSSFLLSHFHPHIGKLCFLPYYKQNKPQDPLPSSDTASILCFRAELLERVSCALCPISLLFSLGLCWDSTSPAVLLLLLPRFPWPPCGSVHRHFCLSAHQQCLPVLTLLLTDPTVS